MLILYFMGIYYDHKDIPGNPSTAKSSKIRLREEAKADSLNVL